MEFVTEIDRNLAARTSIVELIWLQTILKLQIFDQVTCVVCSAYTYIHVMYLNRSKRYTVEAEKKNKDMKAKSEPEMDSKHGVLDALKSLNTTLQVLVLKHF